MTGADFRFSGVCVRVLAPGLAALVLAVAASCGDPSASIDAGTDALDTGAEDTGAEDAGPQDAVADSFDATVDSGPIGPEACQPLRFNLVASGLDQPIFATAPPSDAERVFVVEAGGLIRIVRDGLVLETPFLDVSELVTPGSERGLIGLAFSPDYATNGRFWISSVNSDGNYIVSEYGTSDDPDQADATIVRSLVSFRPAPGNHLAGQLAFGPDGFLYAAIGDGSSAQNIGTFHGKVLRMDVDRYPEPPPGNMTGGGVLPDIWSLGFHNPWRFSFDRATGDMYIADVGLLPPYEEVNVEPAGGGGRNYGYGIMSGPECIRDGCDETGLTQPDFYYEHTEGRCAIMGGYVYRGEDLPCLDGYYVYTDYCAPRVWSLKYEDGEVVHEAELTALGTSFESTPDGLVSFGEDGRGELLLISLSGNVWRLGEAD